MPLTFVRQSVLIGILIMVITVLLTVAIIVLTRPKSDKSLYERKTKKGLIVYHPYIVSLSTQLRNTKQRNFACTGVILSKNWVLVGGDCVETETEWKDLQIRAGSIYWYKDGTIHKVEEYFQSNYGALTALKIFPLLAFNDYVNKVTFADTKNNWRLAYTVDWYTREMSVYKKCLIQTWINTPCVNTEHKLGEIKGISSCKLKLNEKPLITKRRVLIGFHIGLSKVDQETFKHVFLDLQAGYYAQWVRNIVENNKKDIVVKTSVKDTIICGNSDIYACQPFLFDNFVQQSIQNDSVVVEKKFVKEIANAKFESMERKLNLKNNILGVINSVGCVDNIKNDVKNIKVSSITTADNTVASTIRQTTTLTTSVPPIPITSLLETVRTTVIPFTESTVPSTTIATTIKTTTETNTETTTETTMFTTSILLITLLKVMSKSITQTTTEESIWDNLPFEESQFYNPV